MIVFFNMGSWDRVRSRVMERVSVGSGPVNGAVGVREGLWDPDRRFDELRRCHGLAMRGKSEHAILCSVMSHTCTLL